MLFLKKYNILGSSISMPLNVRFKKAHHLPLQEVKSHKNIIDSYNNRLSIVQSL